VFGADTLDWTPHPAEDLLDIHSMYAAVDNICDEAPQSLVKLGLRGLDITTEASVHFFSKNRMFPNLVKLDLCQNYDLGHEAMEALLENKDNFPALEWVDVTETSVISDHEDIPDVIRQLEVLGVAVVLDGEEYMDGPDGSKVVEYDMKGRFD